MFELRLNKSFRALRRKPLFVPLLLLLPLLTLFEYHTENLLLVAATEETTTPEPEASPGCKAPEIRFNVIRPETTTEQPYASFETTENYHSDEDFTTADVEFVERINIDLTGHHHATEQQSAAIVNPYQIDMDGHQQGTGPHAEHGEIGLDEAASLTDLAADADAATTRRRNNAHARRQNKKRRSGQGRRRRLENDNGQSGGRGGGRGSRYKRQVIHYDPDASPETDKWAGGKLAAEGDVYYVHIEDILKSKAPNRELRVRLHKIKKRKKKHWGSGGDDGNRTAIVANVSECFEGDDKTYCRKKLMKKASAANVTKAETVQFGSYYPQKQQQQQQRQQQQQTIVKEHGKTHHRHRGDSHELGASQQSPPTEMASEERLSERSVHTRWRRAKLLAHEEQEKPEGSVNNMSINSGKNDDTDATGPDALQQQEPQQQQTNEPEQLPVPMAETYDNSTSESLQRVKRKSGKTTGALSRPKGGGDSSSKTTSRKDKGIFDEEGGYSPVHPDEADSEEEEDEEEEDIDIAQQFTEVSEIRFPGEIGPLGDRRLCKIRCIKGKWVGPLCATNEEDDNGNVKFQPLYKSCHVNRIPPHLLLSYRNISVTPITSIRGSRRNRTSKSTFVSNTAINVGWDLPHGHSLQARCKDLGLYKLLGETRVLCSNGLWAPRMPSCVPTSLLTNFSDDSAPSIRIKINSGSGAFEPSGVLAVLPGSTINLDCMYPRLRGTPEWTWTSWYMQYTTGWSAAHDEKNLRYRLIIKDIQNSDTGTFTCTSPRGLTNSIMIVVATSTCPQLPEPAPPLSLRLEGNKLGQRALYRCPPGYRIDGSSSNATCLASGNWSSPPPTCQAIQCPRLVLEDPHLSLVELNTSAWGRAVFKCQWGFKLSGPPGLECKPTGVWSGPVPSCRAIQCPTPLAPLNGRIGGTSSSLNQRRLTVGALVTFSCNEGHLLVGEPSIICTETGFWSHPPPFCKSQCPYPGDPPNGLIAPLKFNYDSGDYLTVQCRPGFVQYSENGPPDRPKCMPDGNWSGPVPKCRSYEEV